MEAVSVVVGERELCAGVRTLTPDDHPGPFRPGAEVEQVGDLHDLTVLALRAVLIERRNPSVIGDLEDRGADLLGQLVAEGEPQVRSQQWSAVSCVAPATSARIRISIFSMCSAGICASARSITV